VIDVGISTNDVIKEEETIFLNNVDNINVVILVGDETEGVFCISPK
jgi:hypothetical protein